jgi:hypothetical protein
VAVGRRFGDELRADHTVSAGAVVDDDGLPELRRELLADEAADDVGRTARRERHDHPDRLARRLLGMGGWRRCQRTERRKQDREPEARDGSGAHGCCAPEIFTSSAHFVNSDRIWAENSCRVRSPAR